MAISRDPNHPDFPHGTTYGFRLGDRCPDCRYAKRLDWQAYNARKRANRQEANEDAMTENIAILYFQGLDPMEVEEVCGLVVAYYEVGSDITDSTLRARAEVLAARVLG